ncbi:MAG: type III-A CRISPR-associated RAMP protein Csm3 [Anaerolineae bacterium]|nr:type III-A CRISPR-associated RAMP protein Csm3 [Anaerolineae bacterium]
MKQFKGRYIIQGEIFCRTGLRIGAPSEGMQIGGMENPVIRDPSTDQPYIPGSSLKGRLRYWTEWSMGLISSEGGTPAYPCKELAKEKVGDPEWENVALLARLYGAGSPDDRVRQVAGPSRLTVRDAFLTEESAKELQRYLGEGVFVEEKTENAIDRITSKANPRPLERVPRGARFAFTLLVDVYEGDSPELLRTLFHAMALVEDSSLGSGGSRGHGAVSFRGLTVEWRSRDYYWGKAEARPIAVGEVQDAHELLAKFDEISWEVE